MRRRIGVISDTHGLMRPEALRALAGSEQIIHAGDIGAPEVLAALACIAPVTAVRGNNDIAAWADAIPATSVLAIDGVSVYVLHDVHGLNADAARTHQVVIAGHSHQPDVACRGGVLFVNPGSAGPRRFSLPVTVATLWVEGDEVEAVIEPLELPPSRRR
ncbi:MAG: metallophosphoesterase family protein [Casimicrobiaceae bacterium]